MFLLIFLLFLYVSSESIEYSKLNNFESVVVKPDTRVFLDISTYPVDQSIYLQFNMKLSMGGSQNYYNFKLDQTSASTSEDTNVWENLPKVKSTNVTCDKFFACSFKWTEKKKKGSNYLYIIPLAPYSDFYTFFHEKITVSQIGGKSQKQIEEESKKLTTGGYLGLVFGTIGGAILVTVIISCLCSHSGKSDDGSKNPQPENAQPILPKNEQITEPTNVQPIAPTMVQPTQPTIGPPPPQPYVHMNEY